MCYKLKRLGIFGRFYGFMHLFLKDKHQRVILNRQSSNLSRIEAGVPQGSLSIIYLKV